MFRTDHIARRLSLVLGALLLVPLCGMPAWAGIAFVSGSFTCSNDSALVGSIQLTLTASTTTGNTVAVAVAIPSKTVIVSTVVDSGGSSYTKRASLEQSSGSVGQEAEIWTTSAGGATASTTVTVTNSASNISFNFCVAEYSGATGVGVTATNSGTSGSPTLSLTTEDNNDFFVAAISVRSAQTLTAGTGNFRGQSTQTTGSGTAAVCDNTAATPSSVTCSVNSGGQVWAEVGVDLRLIATCAPTGMLMGVERC